jgi:hypothetical protein
LISNAQLIKEYYRALLNDNKKHTRTDLFSYARSCVPQGITFTEGMLTGALKTLVSDEAEYKCISRGVYQKIPEAADPQPHTLNIVSEYKQILKNALYDMENKIQVNPFDVLNMSDSEKSELKNIQKCMEVMKNILSDTTGQQ